jgi:hypothetical protein
LCPISWALVSRRVRPPLPAREVQSAGIENMSMVRCSGTVSVIEPNGVGKLCVIRPISKVIW